MGGVDGGFDEIDKAWREAPWGSVAFNNPETLNEGDSAVIELILSLRKPLEELTKEVVEAGRREGARVQVTPIMEARLTGTAFDIEAISDERQAVTANQDTRWRWEIRPTTTGKLRLHLTLTGLLFVDGQREPKTVTSFDRFLSVRVTWRDRLQGFASDNWQWLWATLLAPIGLWLWRRRGSLRGPT